jgi:hypothetical protein
MLPTTSRLARPVLAAALLLASCGGSDPASQPTLATDVANADEFAPDIDPADLGDAAAVEPETCTVDTECQPFGKVCDPATKACVQCLVSSECPEPTDLCVSKACQPRTPCKSDKACIGADQLCDEVGGVCVDCLIDGDCSEDRVCRAGSCMPTPPSCRTSKDCSALGQVCSDAGACVNCDGDLDCAELEYCEQTLCLPDLCHAGQPSCADAKTRRTCSDDGSAWVTAACADGTGCVDGACVSAVCTPGAKQCQGAALATCNAQGTAWGAAQACGKDQGCVAGACQALVCQANAKQCNALGGVDTCAADGMGWTSAACPATVEGKAQACDTANGAVCKPLACTPKATFCDGEQAMQCDAQGFAATPAGDCTKPGPTGGKQLCLNGKCTEAKCASGKTMCADPATLATCKPDGSGWSKTPCPDQQACETDQCLAVVCVPDQVTCAGTVVQQCKTSGTGQMVVVDCQASGKVCASGACVTAACKAGATECQGGKLATCKADGSGWVVAACGSNEVCVGGACKATVCAAADVQCQGQWTAKCDATRTGWTPVEDCVAKGLVCKAGACVSGAVCQAGAKQCSGSKLQTCKGDGSGWDEVECDGAACTVGGSCQDGACTVGTPALWSWQFEANTTSCVSDIVRVAGGFIVSKYDCGAIGSGNEVRRVDTQGTKVWSYATKPQTTLALVGDQVFVAALGDSLWLGLDGKAKPLPAGYFLRGAAAVGDEAWAVGDDAVYRFKADGTLAAKIPMTYSNGGTAIAAVASGGAVAAGVTGGSTSVIRLDAAGGTKWLKQFPGGSFLAGVSAFPDGGSLVVGYIKDASTGNVALFRAIRVDASGLLLWAHQFGKSGQGWAAAAFPDGTSQLTGVANDSSGSTGGIWLALDASGNVRWKREDEYHHVHALRVDGDGVLAGGADWVPNSVGRAFVQRADRFGNVSCTDSGACLTKKPEDCSDGKECTSDLCTASSGCVHPQIAPNSVCGPGMTCQASMCK